MRELPARPHRSSFFLWEATYGERHSIQSNFPREVDQ
jgi:hypothetical protein